MAAIATIPQIPYQAWSVEPTMTAANKASAPKNTAATIFKNSIRAV